MSFVDRPTVPLFRKICCFAYIFACIPVVGLSVIVGAWGRCDSSGCLSWPAYLLIFPGLVIAVVGIGALVARWAVKDYD